MNSKRAKHPTQRWVIKAGSNMVCSGGILLIKSWMHQVALLRKKHDTEVIWVTSGAIATAVERTEFKKKSRLLPEKQALSAIGQPLLMDSYNLALQTNGLLGSQILVTRNDLSDSTRLKNFKSTLEKILEWKVVPILNENDAIATEEIKFGDNDNLSAQIACHVKADLLVILTDVKGLYDADPRANPKAKLIPHLSRVTPHLLSSVGKESGSDKGTGGMYSKLAAAKTASKCGIPTHLVKGDLSQILIRISENKAVGTLIKEDKKMSKRK